MIMINLIRNFSNQKVATIDATTLSGLRLVREPGLSSVSIVASEKSVSSTPGETPGAVEVAGIEPASPWMISPGSSQSTPTALQLYQFLGYAIASNAELEEDCTDICRGVYAAKGIKGEKWGEWEGKEIESIPFYPLDPLLPLPVQLKLRTKELNFLLTQL